jgi:hypothetical protein
LLKVINSATNSGAACSTGIIRNPARHVPRGVSYVYSCSDPSWAAANCAIMLPVLTTSFLSCLPRGRNSRYDNWPVAWLGGLGWVGLVGRRWLSEDGRVSQQKTSPNKTFAQQKTSRSIGLARFLYCLVLRLPVVWRAAISWVPLTLRLRPHRHRHRHRHLLPLAPASVEGCL